MKTCLHSPVNTFISLKALPCSIILLLVLFRVTTALAQPVPSDNAVLHYRLVGFNFEQAPTAKKYNLEIAAGYIYNEDSFAANVIQNHESTVPQYIATVPYWNTRYTWRVTYTGKAGKVIKRSSLFHFTTAGTSFADTGAYRLRVTQNHTNGNGLLFFSDGSRALYDMNGQLLWYVPFMPGLPDTTVPLRDLKMTPQHTITFIANTQAYEIDYNGKLLWKAPDDGKVSGDTSEFYHHEFTRLRNGHYMIAGNEYLKKYLPSSFAAKYADNDNIRRENDKYYVTVAYGTLLEYDTSEKLVWSWKSSAYFTDEDLLIPAMFENGHVPGFHYNSFFFDEGKNAIYNSFRDINRIVKISYPGRQILSVYKSANGGRLQFLGQHNCRISKNGNLYLFNNNFANNGRRDAGKPSSLLVLKEPVAKDGEMTVEWAFDCDIDEQAGATAKGGGSVYELANGDMLVCMGTVNRVFIVHGNEILWNAFTEMKNEGRWVPQSNYRVSAIEGEESLRKLVFKK